MGGATPAGGLKIFNISEFLDWVVGMGNCSCSCNGGSGSESGREVCLCWRARNGSFNRCSFQQRDQYHTSEWWQDPQTLLVASDIFLGSMSRQPGFSLEMDNIA